MKNNAFGLFSFFRTPRHQRFDYIPRYYDPDKEDRDRRIKSISREFKDEDEAVSHSKANIRHSFRNIRSTNAASTRSSNIRLIIIITILAALAWWIFLY